MKETIVEYITMNTSEVSFIIPSYNGYDLLKVLLPSLYNVISREKLVVEIIVIDDASTDDSVAELKKLSLPVKIITRSSRGGFARACNEGASSASGSFLFFLNNDMTFETQDEFITPLTKHFDEKNVFAVAPSSMTCWEGKLFDETPTIGKWEKGFLNVFRPGFAQSSGGELFYASGGCMCVRKDKFLELGGFDDLFYPFYFEDVDICWRARKTGMKILHDSSIKLWHKSHCTIDKFYTPFERDVFYWKNYFLFVWKNINDTELRYEHFKNFSENLWRFGMTNGAVTAGYKLAMFSLLSNKSGVFQGQVSDRDLLIICDDSL